MRNTDTTKASEGHKKWTENNKNKYNLNPKSCKSCGKLFSYEKRHHIFCDHSCSAKFNNIGVTRNPFRNKLCLVCQKIIYTKHERCKSCETKFKIENGIHVSSGTIRNYIIKIRGYICEECKNIEWRGNPIPLDLHHIDGDDTNNKNENLKLLCKNCHALTDNYCFKKARRKK